MDPVLQRFGDVTIQRLAKPKDPKVGPQNDIGHLEKSKEEAPSTSDEESAEEGEIVPQSLKRSLPTSEITVKKFKFDKSGDITLEKKVNLSEKINQVNSVNQVNREISDDLNVNNFSDTEISDFDSESEIESDGELNESELGLGEVKPAPKVNTFEDEEENESENVNDNENENENDGDENGTSFLEKLVEEPFLASTSNPPKTSAELTPATDSDDYDYDIKEKLKEMGEISFETVKKGEKPKKTEVTTEDEVSVMPTKKSGLLDEELTAERLKASGVNMRRNIREVMDETKLDEATLAAQRLEVERLRRVQEQQRLIRELQRQAAQERMQHKVISLLQGNSLPKPGSSGTRIGNTVLVKLPNGQTKPMTRLPKRPFDLLRVPKGGPMAAPQPGRSLLSRKPGAHLTPSVSIAPVSKRMMMPPMQARHHSDSDSESEDRVKPPMMTAKRRSRDGASTSAPTPIEVSSDDDCIVVSESENEPGTGDEPEEDPSNSGMHTNDEFNQPDEQGRVLVNVGHSEDDPDVFLAPQIGRIIKPHQIGGVRFLYDNVVESTSRFDSSPGFGCILAHSMGLGKTLQVVCFSDIFLRHTPAKTILCIMPINTLQNWLAEYNMWLPTEEAAPNSPLNGHGEVRARNFNLHVLNDSHKTLVARAKVIHEWRSKGGVLLIGYEQFRLLSLKKHPKSRRKPNPNSQKQAQEDDKNKALFDEVHEALVSPGPDLVICDEGHRIKNSHASISQALKQMRTKRRVVLTGYPLQNNLMEYWCMVDFVRPNYLGTKTEFCNMFERPIMNGQCIDSTDADIKLMRYRAHVLHSLLLGFVQRRSHRVLQTALPQKEEYVLLVRMTPFQRKLYETFMNEVVRSQTVPNPLKAFAVCCKIWNHPDVLYNFLMKRAKGDAVDIDLEEVASTTGSTSSESPASSKARKPPARPRRPPKGKNAGKPAASVTPYNSTTDQPSPDMQEMPPQQNQFQDLPQQNLLSHDMQQNSFPAPSSTSSFSDVLQHNQIKTECGNMPASSFCQNSNSSFNNESFTQNPSFFDFDQTNSQFPPGYADKNNFNQTYQETSEAQQTTNSTFTNSIADSGLGFNFGSQASTSQATTNFSSGVTPVESISTPPPPNSSSNLLELVPQNPQNANNFSNISCQNQENAANQFSQNQPNSNFNNQNNSQFSQNQQNSDFNDQNTPLPNFENFNQPNFQNYQQHQQNYWGQQTENYNQQNDYFNACGQPYNPNFSSNNSNQSWLKKEDKPFMNNMIMSPIKSESSNDSKPKINIISDIKLPPVFTPPEKKINIISDIKIEPKIENSDEKPEIKFTDFLKPKEEVKEVKVEEKSLEKTPERIEKALESPLAKLSLKESKEDSGIPYDWAIELLKDYVPGCIENSGKMEILFCILKESIALGDRTLVFSQSLITLDLIEQFLQMNVIPGDTQKWARNVSYYRLDGSTSALEREKLINEFNSNPKIHVFLVSTRAGSLGINLIGANRVVVLDASWNPCHDTQAVCRVYRYGQRKPCFVYRLVVDNCMEKKIYDRQINKQGMSDRVVDECNPDAHLTIKDVSTLCWDDKKDEGEEKDWSHVKDNYIDVVLQKVLDRHSRRLNKEPFQHESLLVDRKEKQLSQQEKRLAKKGYEREKQAARQPTYLAAGARGHRPVASVRPMQQGERPSRWIPAEHWQRQGMTAQEMTLPLDVVIPTNQPEKGNIVLKAGQKVLVLKSPKGVYMQLESGKIVAIKTAIKVKGKAEDNHDPTKMIKSPNLPPTGMKLNPNLPNVLPPKRLVKPFTPGVAKMNVRSVRQTVPNLVSHLKNVTKKVQMAKTRPYQLGSEMAKAVSHKDLHEMPLMPSGSASSDDEHNSSSNGSERMSGIESKMPEMKGRNMIEPSVPSSPEEEKFVENKEINKRISQLKKQISIQRVTLQSPKQTPKPPQQQIQQLTSPALERLEQTTSNVNESNLPFQDTLDSITNSYKDDNLEDDESMASSTDPKQARSQTGSDISDQSDEVTYVSEQPAQQPYPNQSNMQTDQQPQKPDGNPPNSTQDYGYNNYYGYNMQPPYHAPHPPPPQGYGYPPHQPPPYDMMGGYPPQHQQPPQYNYGYQGYPPPPQPHYAPPPQPGYDYNAPPPQPIYAGYHPPYPPQQYPPPPPPQGMYPPPPAPTTAAPPYTGDYQQYPPMNTAAPPPTQTFFPNT